MMVERAKQALSSKIRSWAVTTTSLSRISGTGTRRPGSDAGRLSLCLGYWEPHDRCNFLTRAIGADIALADVISPDNEDVGFLLPGHRNHGLNSEQAGYCGDRAQLSGLPSHAV